MKYSAKKTIGARAPNTEMPVSLLPRRTQPKPAGTNEAPANTASSAGNAADAFPDGTVAWTTA